MFKLQLSSQAALWRRPAKPMRNGANALCHGLDVQGWQRAPHHGGREWLALPFEMARHAHAVAVRGGVLPLSMRESQRFEQLLSALERWLLGPLARRV